MENLLERFKQKAWHIRTFGSNITMRLSGIGVQSEHAAYDQIPWDDVVVICIDHKLKDWQLPEPPVCEGEDVIYGKHIFNFYAYL